MKITKIDLSKVKDGENPLINAVWKTATKKEIDNILSKITDFNQNR